MVEVVQPFPYAEGDVGARLFARLGDMHGPHQPPGRTIDGGPGLAGALFGDRPVGRQGVEAARRSRADRQQAGAVSSGRVGAGGRHLAGDGDLDRGARERGHLQVGFAELEPVGLVRHRLAAQQANDAGEGLVHAVALLGHRDAHHVGVGRQGAGADPENHSPAGDVIQLVHAVGQHEGVVIGQGRDAGAQADMPGALGGRGDEQLRAGDDLVAGRVVLTDPGFVVAECVHQLHELEISLDRQRRVLAQRVERRDEGFEAHLGSKHRVSCRVGFVPVTIRDGGELRR